jgi:hypothetical protein
MRGFSRRWASPPILENHIEKYGLNGIREFGGRRFGLPNARVTGVIARYSADPHKQGEWTAASRSASALDEAAAPATTQGRVILATKTTGRSHDVSWAPSRLRLMRQRGCMAQHSTTGQGMGLGIVVAVLMMGSVTRPESGPAAAAQNDRRTLVFSTYFGETSETHGTSVAVDRDGDRAGSHGPAVSGASGRLSQGTAVAGTTPSSRSSPPTAGRSSIRPFSADQR